MRPVVGAEQGAWRGAAGNGAQETQRPTRRSARRRPVLPACSRREPATRWPSWCERAGFGRPAAAISVREMAPPKRSPVISLRWGLRLALPAVFVAVLSANSEGTARAVKWRSHRLCPVGCLGLRCRNDASGSSSSRSGGRAQPSTSSGVVHHNASAQPLIAGGAARANAPAGLGRPVAGSNGNPG